MTMVGRDSGLARPFFKLHRKTVMTDAETIHIVLYLMTGVLLWLWMVTILRGPS